MNDDQWLATTEDGGDHVHVVPIGDLIEHDQDERANCICGPQIEVVPRDDGTSGLLISHHSLDGRELLETASQ